MIWKHCWKRVFVGRAVLETSVASAVVVFNASAVFNEKGGHSIAGLNCTDSQRIQDANQKSSESIKKKLCAVRKKEKAFCCKKRLP